MFLKFGDRLKLLREAKGMTQEELGEVINQRKANISKYENGKLEPSIETIKAIANYFKVSIDYLLANTEEAEIDIDGYKIVIHRWIREGKTPKQAESDDQLLRELKEKFRELL